MTARSSSDRYADNGVPVERPDIRLALYCPRCGRPRTTRHLSDAVFYTCRTPGCFGALERVHE